MPNFSLLIRLGFAVVLMYFLSFKAGAADDIVVTSGPGDDVSGLLAHEADLVRVAQHEDTAVKTEAPALTTTSSPIPDPIVTSRPASPQSTASASGPRDYTADNIHDLMVHETNLIQQAQERTTGQKNSFADPISELIIHEAALIASAGAGELPQKVVAKRVDRVSLAERMVGNEDYRMASSILHDIAKSVGATDDERARAELLIAQISLHQGHRSDAVIELSSWLGEFPHRRESPFVHFLLGQCYRDMGAFEQARDCFYRVMSGSLVAASSSDNAGFTEEKKLVRAAIWELAETEYERRNWERSLTFFDRFNAQNATGDQLTEAALFRKADCQYQMHQTDDATASYEKALSVAPFHPFAPEAWLRLYFLYGMQHRTQKQIDSMQALTWLVNTLQPSRVAYWQQRGISMMLELPQEGRPQLVQLRDALRGRAEDPGWKPICDYLEDICSRFTLDKSFTKQAQASVGESSDGWGQWKTDYMQKRDQLQQEAKPLLDRGPIEDSPVKKNL